MVRGIGEALRLQAESVTGNIGAQRVITQAIGVDPMLAGCDRCQVVAGVKVHGGLGSQHFQTDKGFVASNVSGTAQTLTADDITVVVAAAVLQRLEVGVNVAAQRFFGRKVHRRTCHGQQTARGNALGIGFQILVGVHGYQVIQHAAGIVAVEVKIAVVRQVADRRRIGLGMVINDKSMICQAIIQQRVTERQGYVAGETVGARGAGSRQGHTVIRHVGRLVHVEQCVLEAVGTAVQAVAVLVGRNVHGFAVQRESRAPNAVGKAAHDRAHEIVVLFILGDGVIAQHNVDRELFHAQ